MRGVGGPLTENYKKSLEMWGDMGSWLLSSVAIGRY